MTDSPAARAAVPKLAEPAAGPAGGSATDDLLIRGATVVTSLEPPASSAPTSTSRAIGSPPSGPAWPSMRPARRQRLPGRAGQRQRPHARLLGAGARHALPLAPPTNFLEILQRVWWRLDRALDPASIRASALVAGREALLAGTTTLIDHHASPNAIDGSLDLSPTPSPSSASAPSWPTR
jgi:hypothetical protein